MMGLWGGEKKINAFGYLDTVEWTSVTDRQNCRRILSFPSVAPRVTRRTQPQMGACKDIDLILRYH